ncbi:MAG: hypothetical protein JKY90_08350 [Gammaproteobacteria bacterium]|nr:hypothetical protein [Gammaproteobacteria bacterium]
MKTLGYLLLTFAFICAAFIGWVWWINNQAQLYQIERAPQVEATYGFTVSTPQIRVDDRRRQVITIQPNKNGLLYVAGFRENDILLSHQMTAFYKALYHQNSDTLHFNVLDGGDGLPLNQRELRTITLPPLVN